jgi:hypothetical protein
MGYNYEITENDELQIRGFNCEEDLQATLDFKGLIRRYNYLKRRERELGEEEEQELSTLSEYVTTIEDEDDEDENDEVEE